MVMWFILLVGQSSWCITMRMVNFGNFLTIHAVVSPEGRVQTSSGHVMIASFLDVSKILKQLW